MELHTLIVAARERKGKGGARKVRAAGEVPGVLYGLGQEPVCFKVSAHVLDHLLRGRAGEHAIVELEVADKPGLNCPALLKEVQHHPVHGHVLHADFLRIRLDTRITTLVSVQLTGQAIGAVEGGVLYHQLREVEVECLALEVPDEFRIDVTELAIGSNLHVADLVAPENVTVVTDPERVIVAVHAPRVLKTAEEEAEEAAVAEEGEETAPEVIGEKKEEEQKEEK